MKYPDIICMIGAIFPSGFQHNTMQSILKLYLQHCTSPEKVEYKSNLYPKFATNISHSLQGELEKISQVTIGIV